MGTYSNAGKGSKAGHLFFPHLLLVLIEALLPGHGAPSQPAAEDPRRSHSDLSAPDKNPAAATPFAKCCFQRVHQGDLKTFCVIN